MAYTKNDDGTVTLDTGEVIDLSISHERLVNGAIVYKVSASCDDVSVEHHHTVEVLDDNVARNLLLLVLGEETELLVSDDIKRSASIRHHLAVEKAQQPDHTSLL